MFTLIGIEETAIQTIRLVEHMRTMMSDYKRRLRTDFSFYSQDLLNNLFRHPYTKIEFVQNELRVTRKTASGYLKRLVEKGYLRLVKVGKVNFYLNDPLIDLFINAHHNEKSPNVSLIESITH